MSARILILQSRMSIDFLVHYVIKKNQFRTITMGDNSQWYFPLSALASTPSASPRPRELYDRARGVEFLFRLGSSLALSVFMVSVHHYLTLSSVLLQLCAQQQLGFIASIWDTPWTTFTVKYLDPHRSKYLTIAHPFLKGCCCHLHFFSYKNGRMRQKAQRCS